MNVTQPALLHPLVNRARSTRLAGLLLWSGLAYGIGALPAQAAGPATLATVAPVVSCESLAKYDLSHVADTPAAITWVKTIDSPVGAFCRVLGTVSPSVNFEVDLPIQGWQQRYLQTGCGGLCGNLRVEASHAGTCTVALQGGLAMASDDMGHQTQMGPPGSGPSEGAFGADPQKRIDFAYRGNHVTVLVSKALIKAFYGQAPRYSYFSGCSDGGREALVEAERYPQDFDGIAAGAAAMNFQVQNSFYHAWQYRSNTDAEGRHILLASRLPILHRAALAQCDALDGLTDGLISEPLACHFDPGTAQCAVGATDTSDCLSAAEVAVARKLYAGPTDAAGHHFTVGGPEPGSELQWAGVYVPATIDGMLMSQMAAASSSQYVIFPEVSAAEGDIGNFAFTQEHFAKLAALHPLYDGTDTDLAPFQRRGGKLLLWHGWSDPHISPMNSIAFYSGVRKLLGDTTTDTFMRLFLFAGMGHCGGGDGFSQFDVLTPLMSWVEAGSAPEKILAAQVPERRMGPPPRSGANGPSAAGSAPAPLPQSDDKALKTRPVYPYPLVAKYTGQGSPDDAANFTAVASSVSARATYIWEGAAFYAPDSLKQYTVKNSKLTATGTVN